MKILNTLLFVMFALSANAADGTVGTVSVQKGNNVSMNGEAPLSLTLDGKDHVCQRNLSQTKLVSTQEKNGLGKRG